MGRERKTVGSLAMEQVPRVISIPPVNQEQTRKLRVAAYARVSSDSDDQLHSFAAQTAHYTELIHQNPDWEFVDVYADKGITGTSAEKERISSGCWQTVAGGESIRSWLSLPLGLPETPKKAWRLFEN